MTRRLKASVVTVAFAASSLVYFASPAEAQIHYRNCDALHRDYRHGVAKSMRAARKQVRDGYGLPAYGRHAKRIYWANHVSLDADNDGTACEA